MQGSGRGLGRVDSRHGRLAGRGVRSQREGHWKEGGKRRREGGVRGEQRERQLARTVDSSTRIGSVQPCAGPAGDPASPGAAAGAGWGARARVLALRLGGLSRATMARSSWMISAGAIEGRRQ